MCRDGEEMKHRRLEGVSEAFCLGVWCAVHYYSPRETCVSVAAMEVVVSVAVAARAATTRRAGAAVVQETVGRDVLRRLVSEGSVCGGGDECGDRSINKLVDECVDKCNDECVDGSINGSID